ncbi:MAG: MFS transporter [Nocardioidaceae bacterium]|nr:MFS transporter [Nocardioidaceae bacterium]
MDSRRSRGESGGWQGWPVPTRPLDRRDTDPQVERARQAVAAVFALNGLGLATWLSRTPAVRDTLDLSASGLGLLLVCLSIGAVLGLPSSGPVVHRIGPRRAVLGGAGLVSLGLVGLAAGLATELVALAAASLLLIGLGTSSWDVAMNVEGAEVERRLARTLMPRLHAGFSLGTVAGALFGAGCAATGVGAPAQLLVSAGMIAMGVLLACPALLRVDDPEPGTAGSVRSGALGAWRERRTLLVGLLVLGFAFTEGTANDWLAIALVDGHDSSEAVGALGFGAFLAAMTLCRMVGGSALERFGRVLVLRATAALAVVGLLLVVAGPNAGVAAAGAMVWGVGAALGFPVGMSAAADQPDRSAARVSVVASIGYTAFLAGPPLVGFVADQIGVRPALLVLLVPLGLAVTAAGATRTPPKAESDVSTSAPTL